MIKKASVFLVLSFFAAGADALAAEVRGIRYGGVESPSGGIMYESGEYENRPKWHVGGQFAANMASFKITSELDGNSESESHSFKRVNGFDVSVGYRFAPEWRAGLEYGYLGLVESKGDAASMDIRTHYLFANAAYTIKEWGRTGIYAGAGLGLAMLDSDMTGIIFKEGGVGKSSYSLAAELKFGIEEAISDNFSVGAEYRLMYAGGAKHSRTVDGYYTISHLDETLTSKVSGILSNSIMIGAKFKF